MAQVTGTLSLTFRHRWLGLAFLYVAAAPFLLLGAEPGDRATDLITHLAYRLMGPKVTIT